MKRYIGVDIGGTKCAVMLGVYGDEAQAGPEAGTLPVTIIDRIRFPTEAGKGPEQTLEHIFTGIEAILARNRMTPSDAIGIGVSCGGPLDSRRGLILSPPNLPGWDEIPIVPLLTERFGIPARLQNDANACALAEWKFGAGRGFMNMVFLTFGTGMGAGFILDGRLYSGASDMAGEVGHMRIAEHGPVGYGKAGSFEGFCSGGGIAQLAGTYAMEKLQMGQKVSFCKDAASIGEISARSVAEAAEAGDELALEVYRACGRYLGKGLAVIVDFLNPERIVIGSIFARSGHLLWPAAREVLERESLGLSAGVCSVVPAALGDSIGDYAALAVAASEN